MAYIDDIIIFSMNKQELNEITSMKLKEAGLKLKESKGHFFKHEIHYLGHLISVNMIQPLPEKLDSICDMPKPRSPKEIKQFIGLTSYYRKFVPQFSDMARLLTKLLAHDCGLIWDKQCDISFQMLQDILCSAPIPIPLYNKAIHAVRRCQKLWWSRSTHSKKHISNGWERNHNGPSSIISQWIVPWQSIKLGCSYKVSLCYLHVL